MADNDQMKQPGGRGGLAAIAIGVAAVACCAGLPLVAALAGGLAVGTLLGVAAGLVAIVVGVGAVAVRVRERHRAAGR